ILRVLRLITAVPTLRRVVAGRLPTLPGLRSNLLLSGLLYYPFSVMGAKAFGAANPEPFGTPGQSPFTLVNRRTLDGWTDHASQPVMEHHPYGWVYLITFIVVTTFMVLNLFIGVVVNAMQSEAEKAEEAERAAERVMIQEEAAPILSEVKHLRREVAELRAEFTRAKASG